MSTHKAFQSGISSQSSAAPTMHSKRKSDDMLSTSEPSSKRPALDPLTIPPMPSISQAVFSTSIPQPPAMAFPSIAQDLPSSFLQTSRPYLSASENAPSLIQTTLSSPLQPFFSNSPLPMQSQPQAQSPVSIHTARSRQSHTASPQSTSYGECNPAEILRAGIEEARTGPLLQAIEMVQYHMKNYERDSSYCLPPSLIPTALQRTVPHSSLLIRCTLRLPLTCAIQSAK